MSRIYEEPKPRDLAMLERVRKDFFQNSPIILDPNQDSQGVRDGTIVLGLYAGISCDITNLLHEMSHFVEIDDKRMTQYGWGLKFGRVVNIPGYPTFYEPSTWQGTQRELRVSAFQVNLMRHYKLQWSFNSIASVLRHVHDHIMVPESKDKSVRQTDRSEAFLAEQLRGMVDQPQYSLDSFRKEWDRKHAVLQKKVRRKQAV